MLFNFTFIMYLSQDNFVFTRWRHKAVNFWSFQCFWIFDFMMLSEYEYIIMVIIIYSKFLTCLHEVFYTVLWISFCNLKLKSSVWLMKLYNCMQSYFHVLK